MLAMRLARFEHLVDIGRIGELRGVERSTAIVARSRATTRDVVIEHDAMVADAVPLLALVTPHDRPLPDPQPRHGRRLARPRRSGGRVPGGGRCPRRLVRGCCRRGASARWRPPISSTACGRPRWSPTSCSPRFDSRCGTGRCGFGVAEFARRHGDFAIAGAVAGVELGSERHDRALRHRPVRPRLGAGAGERGRSGRHRAVDRRRLARRDRRGSPSATSATRARISTRRRATARRVGAAMAAKAWNQAVEEAGRA